MHRKLFISRSLSLAQFDAKITKEIIEIDGCIVETLVEMLSPAEYMEALTRGFRSSVLYYETRIMLL